MANAGKTVKDLMKLKKTHSISFCKMTNQQKSMEHEDGMGWDHTKKEKLETTHISSFSFNPSAVSL